jgi:hypothetical protein
MSIIDNKAIISPDTNMHLTTLDLTNKGLTHDDVIKVANDLESKTHNRIKYQFTDTKGIKIDNKIGYTSALDTLHKYLHSFNI